MKLTKIVEDIYQQMTGKIDDHEAEMAITDLKSIASRAAQLAAHLEKGGHQELEGWIQSKITKSADYINAVYDNYMFSPDHECNTCGDNSVNEGIIKVFSYAKPYTKPDAAQLRAKADDFIKKLQAKNYTTHTGSDVIYFPEYKNLGPSFGALAGSNTIIIQPVDSDKIFKIGEGLLARVMSDGTVVGYLLKGSVNEATSTCCGRCGHYHVKGTSCPKPYLTGKRHCRNRPK